MSRWMDVQQDEARKWISQSFSRKHQGAVIHNENFLDRPGLVFAGGEGGFEGVGAFVEDGNDDVNGKVPDNGTKRFR